MFKKLNKKGFTLAELLVVVAIIGVLVAISIPIFTSQLEKAREATDAANIRAAYAEVSANLLTEDDTTKYASLEQTVKAKQTQDGWQGTDFATGDNKIGGQNVAASTKGWKVTPTYDTTNKVYKVTITAQS